MKQLLEQINKYLRRKLKELEPEFISIVVMVPDGVHRDLADEYPSGTLGDRPIIAFTEGDWPNETNLNLTPIPEEE